MNTSQKANAMRAFAKRIRYSQAVVFSDEGNLGDVDNILEEVQPRSCRPKPSGLWFSLGRAWLNWLDDPETVESWKMKRFQWITHVYSLRLANSVLKINTEPEFDVFEKEFANKARDGINWLRVARHCDGILIRFLPTKARRGSASPWYWDWDVSGGCVWDKSGVRSTKLLRAWEPNWKQVA